MELEITRLSQMRQTQKGKYYVFSFLPTWSLDFKARAAMDARACTRARVGIR